MMWHRHGLELVIIGLNAVVVFLIAARLQLHRSGVFSIGFFNLFTAQVPHYVIAPLYMLFMGDYSIYSDNFTTALLLIFVQLQGILFGVLLASKRDVPFYGRVKEHAIPLRHVLGLFLIFIIASLGLRFVFMGTFDPIRLLQAARTSIFRQYYEEYELGYSTLLLQGGLLFLHALLVVHFYKASKSFPSFAKGLIVTALVAYVSLSYGSRTSFFMPIILFLFFTHHLYRRVPLWLIGMLFLLLIPVFVFIRILSAGHELGFLFDSGLTSDSSFILQEFIGRFGNFVSIVDFLDWLDGQPFAFGSTILQFPLRPIPRTILPNKPSSLDVFLSYEIYGRPEYGGNVHIFGGVTEMYYNYWFIGVFCWFILVGYLLYRFHFGTLGLLKEKRYLASVLILSNFGYLRGLANLGVTTSSTQQMIMNITSQVLVMLILKIMSSNTGHFGRKSPSLLLNNPIDVTDSLSEHGQHLAE